MFELYGHKYPVVKEQRVGHVQKTFGTALRNYKKNIKMDGLRYRMENAEILWKSHTRKYRSFTQNEEQCMDNLSSNDKR